MNWRGSTTSTGDHYRYSGYSNGNPSSNDRRHGYSDPHSRGRQTSIASSSSRLKKYAPTLYEPNARHQGQHGRFGPPSDHFHQPSPQQPFQRHYPQSNHTDTHTFSTSYQSPHAHALLQPQTRQDPQRMLTGGQRSSVAYGVTLPPYGANAVAVNTTPFVAKQQASPVKQSTSVSDVTQLVPPEPAAIAEPMPFNPAKFDSRLENPEFCMQLMTSNSLNFYSRHEPPPFAAASAGIFSRPPNTECVDELVEVAKKKGIFDDLRAACGKKLQESPFFEKVKNRVLEEAQAYLARSKFQPTLNKHVEFDRLKKHIAKRTQASQQISQVLEGMPRHHLLSGKSTTAHAVLSTANGAEDGARTNPAAIYNRLSQLISTTLREKYPATSKPMLRSSKRRRLASFEDDSGAVDGYPEFLYQYANDSSETEPKRIKAEFVAGLEEAKSPLTTAAVHADFEDTKPASVMSNQSVVMSEEGLAEAHSASSGNNSMDVVEENENEGGETPKVTFVHDAFVPITSLSATLDPPEDALPSYFVGNNANLASAFSPITAAPSTVTLIGDVQPTTIDTNDANASNQQDDLEQDLASTCHPVNNFDADYADASNPSSSGSKTVVSMPSLHGELASPTPSPLVRLHVTAVECHDNVTSRESPPTPTGSSEGAVLSATTESVAANPVDDGVSDFEAENLVSFNVTERTKKSEYGTPETAVTDTEGKKSPPIPDSPPIVVNKRSVRNRAKPTTVQVKPATKTSEDGNEKEEKKQQQSPMTDTAATADESAVGRRGAQRTRQVNVRYAGDEFVTNIPGLRKKQPAKNAVKSKPSK